MSKFGHEYPRFFISAFIACPLDQVEEFTGMVSVVDLGVKNLRDFKFRFIIDNDGWWKLNLFTDWVWECWFQHSDVENQVYSTETVQNSEGD